MKPKKDIGILSKSCWHVTFVNRVDRKVDFMPVVEAGDVEYLFSERRAHEFPLDTQDLHRI